MLSMPWFSGSVMGLDLVRASAICDCALDVLVRGTDRMFCGVVVRPTGGVVVRDRRTIGSSGSGVVANIGGCVSGGGVIAPGGVRVRGIDSGGADDGFWRRGASGSVTAGMLPVLPA